MRFKNNIRVVAAVSALKVVAACATTGNTVEPVLSASLTAPEIQELLVGKTYPFSKGGTYFSSPSEATAIWDGKTEGTSWYATDDSSFCYTPELFGGAEECIGLSRTADGNYVQTFDGKPRVVEVDEIVDGRTF